MRHKLFVALAIFTVVSLTAVNATAQRGHRFTIPFDFMVGDNPLPAGKYSVIQVSRHTLRLTSQDKSVAAIVTTEYDETGNQKTPALVFTCIGRERFLTTMWFDRTDGLRVAQGRAEREILRALKEEPSDTVVALR